MQLDPHSGHTEIGLCVAKIQDLCLNQKRALQPLRQVARINHTPGIIQSSVLYLWN